MLASSAWEVLAPKKPSEEEDKAFGRIAENLAAEGTRRMPKGGVFTLDGRSGIGKSSLPKSLSNAMKNLGQRLVSLDLDGFLRDDEIRRRITRQVAQAGKIINDHYRSVIDLEEANRILIPLLAFVGSDGDPHEERTFHVPKPYDHSGQVQAHTELS